MKTFLTVGTKDIYADFLCPIEDSTSLNIKPAGGLWATTYYPDTNYNPWVDYLLNNVHLLYYKTYGSSIFNKPCSILYMKDNTNIFELYDKSTLDYLIELFPSNNNIFSFEALSQYFDGIYINLNKLLCDKDINDETKKSFLSFGVDTLLLFNTNAISHYYSAELAIEPFDYEEFNEVINYKITVDDEIKLVKPTSINYQKLIDSIYHSLLYYFQQENINYEDINKSKLIHLINKFIEEFKEISEIKNNPNIERQLLKKFL